MLRKVLMWLGWEPVGVSHTRITRLREGQWKVDVWVWKRPWATDEDVQIVLVKVRIAIQEVVGGKCRFTVLKQGKVDG